MKKTLIEVENLFFSFEERTILKNVNLTIYQGEFLGVIGPNGGGKTTLLHLLMGFYKPQKGTLLINNKPPENARELIGFVPQTLSFDRAFPISVMEVVLMGSLSEITLWGTYKKKTIEKAEQSLEELGILHLKNRPFGTLSGGQIQRVLIARSLTSDPHILFLDEPTASVDAESQEVIFSLLRKLKGKKTVIMVTHHIQSILKDISRVICVDTTVSTINPAEVCKHYALGVYHQPKSGLYDL